MTSQNRNVVEEMHGRIDTLSSQIERAKTDAEDLRREAARAEAQVTIWEELRRDYHDVLSAYAKTRLVTFETP